MGAFNELRFTEPSGERELLVQFKFGVSFQFRYSVGDVVDVSVSPQLGKGEHLASGLVRDDVENRWRYFRITIRDGVISSCTEIGEEEYDILDAHADES